MKKYLTLAVVAVSALCFSASISFAEDAMPPMKPPIGEMGMKPEFKGPPPEFNKHKFHHGPSKAEMDAKKAEIDKRLNLSDKQKKQIEENRIKDIEKVKPIFDEMKAKKHEMRMLNFDTNLNAEQKEAKKVELQSQIDDLKAKADVYRQENMKNFESILTSKQKKEFSKIREEQKQEMEKRKAEFEKMRKDMPKPPECSLPVQPKPQPVEK